MLEKMVGFFERIHGGKRRWSKEQIRVAILEFAICDFIIKNTWLKKRNSHLITFKSGTNVILLDFIVTQKVYIRCKNCKIPRGSVITQHRSVMLDICIRRCKKGDNK